ncbi:hypothetical protein Tco_0224151 [Tanacetum coccineum]
MVQRMPLTHQHVLVTLLEIIFVELVENLIPKRVDGLGISDIRILGKGNVTRGKQCFLGLWKKLHERQRIILGLVNSLDKLPKASIYVCVNLIWNPVVSWLDHSSTGKLADEFLKNQLNVSSKLLTETVRQSRDGWDSLTYWQEEAECLPKLHDYYLVGVIPVIAPSQSALFPILTLSPFVSYLRTSTLSSGYPWVDPSGSGWIIGFEYLCLTTL